MIGDDRHKAWLLRKEQERLDAPADIEVQMASNKEFHTFMAEMEKKNENE